MTVITNGINVISYLQNFNIRVICTGGIIDSDDRAVLVGNETVKRIKDMRANLLFFAPQALDDNGDMFDCYPEEVAAIQAMLANAATRVCLCDSTKIGKSSSFKQTDMNGIDILVCDIPQWEKFGRRFPRVRYL